MGIRYALVLLLLLLRNIANAAANDELFISSRHASVLLDKCCKRSLLEYQSSTLHFDMHVATMCGFCENEFISWNTHELWGCEPCRA